MCEKKLKNLLKSTQLENDTPTPFSSPSVKIYIAYEASNRNSKYPLVSDLEARAKVLNQKRYELVTNTGIIKVSHAIVVLVLNAIGSLNSGNVNQDSSIPKIADKAGCSVSSVKLAIKVLKEKKLVFGIIRRADGNGGFVYLIED